MKLVIIVIKSLLGLIYFVITVTFGINLFMDIDGWGELIYKKMDYKVSQKFLGGEITEIFENKDFYSRIHKPVFDGVFKSSNKGFVQIDWLSNNALPDHFSEEFDYNKDGLIDFRIDFYLAEDRIFLKKYSKNVLNLLDKTAMGLLNLRGFSDNRYSIFTYHNYKEALFLEYNYRELSSIDLIKDIIIPEQKEDFDKFLNQIINGNKNISIICDMNRKITGVEKVKIIYKEEPDDDDIIYKLYFKVIDNKRNEELSVYINDITSIKFSEVFPINSFKHGNSVRVLIKK